MRDAMNRLATVLGRRRRWVLAAWVLIVALALPALAGAKGPVGASISGPGLDRALTVHGDGEGPGTALGNLTMASGFFAQLLEFAVEKDDVPEHQVDGVGTDERRERLGLSEVVGDWLFEEQSSQPGLARSNRRHLCDAAEHFGSAEVHPDARSNGERPPHRREDL